MGWFERKDTPEYKALVKENGRKLRENLSKPVKATGNPILDAMGNSFRQDLLASLSTRKVVRK